MAGVIRRFITQKIKHPITKKWIETMYMTDDGAGNDIKIYWHGAPADNNIIELNHLSDDALSGIQENITINSAQIEDHSITTDDIGDGQIKSRNLDGKAVKTVNLDDEAVTFDKLAGNLKTTLSATVADGILNLPRLT